MILDIKGDLLKSAPKGSLIGIPVNTMGVAGRGLAKYMKLAWPEVYQQYCKDCRKGRIASGVLRVYDTEKFSFAMLPTKYGWSSPSEVSLIKVTIARLLQHMEKEFVAECHIPWIGCGEKTGTLDYWVDVRPVLNEVFGEDVEQLLRVYEW